MYEQAVRPDDASRWPEDLADGVERIRDAGVAGAGGAGFFLREVGTGGLDGVSPRQPPGE